MADKVVGVQLTADTSGATTNVKNFKQELKLAQQEVVTLSEKFGVTSKEAAAAAQKAAQLKDAVGDAKSLVDAFNPDTKFRAFGASINTVVGGFTALQGVLGLVGVESEEVQKSLLKVQSALALSQGFAQVQEGVQTFKNLGAVIQASTIFQKANAAATAIATTVMRAFGASAATSATGFKVLKTAIAATGIGLLVVGLAAAADALGFFSSKSDDAASAQARLNAEIEQVNESLDTESAIMAQNERLAIAQAKRRGDSAAKIFQIEQSYRAESLQATKDHLKALSDQNSDAAKKLLLKIDSQEKELVIKQIEFETAESARRRQAAEKAAADAKAFAERLERERLRIDKNPIGTIQGLDIAIPKTEKQIQIENEENALLKAASTNEATKNLITNTDKLATDIHGENVRQRIANEQAELVAKESFANSSITILTNLSGLVGRQTTAGKIIALAEITAGTAKGFINALTIAQASAKATGPAAAFAFPVFYATQIAAVLGAAAKAKGILGSGGGIGGGSSATPNLSVSAPLTLQRAQQQTTTLDQQSLNAIGNATTRAYVLESDVSGNQERIRRLNRAARLGNG